MEPQLVETIRCQQGWDYRHHSADSMNDLMKKMHDSGQEGWESFQVLQDGGTWHVFMKRTTAVDE